MAWYLIKGYIIMAWNIVKHRDNLTFISYPFHILSPPIWPAFKKLPAYSNFILFHVIILCHITL